MSKYQLLCLPFAGAGASFFNEWKPYTERLDVLAVQLPGREKRFCEPCYTDVFDAVAGILPEVSELVDADRKVIVFGHSLGAVLAYELTRSLATAGTCRIAGLVVSGSPDPWTPRKERATGLDDEEFLNRVSEFAGYTHSALDDPLMRELLLPTLRADVQMHENYRPQAETRVDVPILMVRGSGDELISSEQLAGWKSATSATAHAESLPGGHMYLTERPNELLGLIEDLFL
ncbi:MAG: thioesterase [Lysobacter sp.]|nr:thioesterase [Lysobacter sp.]